MIWGPEKGYWRCLATQDLIAQECFFDRIQNFSQLTGTMIDAHFFAKIQPTVLPSLERENSGSQPVIKSGDCTAEHFSLHV